MSISIIFNVFIIYLILIDDKAHDGGHTIVVLRFRSHVGADNLLRWVFLIPLK